MVANEAGVYMLMSIAAGQLFGRGLGRLLGRELGRELGLVIWESHASIGESVENCRRRCLLAGTHPGSMSERGSLKGLTGTHPGTMSERGRLKGLTGLGDFK